MCPAGMSPACCETTVSGSGVSQTARPAGLRQCLPASCAGVVELARVSAKWMSTRLLSHAGCLINGPAGLLAGDRGRLDRIQVGGVQPAGALVIVGHAESGRRGVGADGHRMRAARVEPAASR